MRVVLDTNILISALITKGTSPDKLYQAWRRGEIDLVTSIAQIRELTDVLARDHLPKFLHADEATALVENIGTRAVILDELRLCLCLPIPWTTRYWQQLSPERST